MRWPSIVSPSKLGVETSYAAPMPAEAVGDPARERGVGGVARRGAAGRRATSDRSSRFASAPEKASGASVVPSGAGWSCSEKAQTITASSTGTSAAR